MSSLQRLREAWRALDRRVLDAGAAGLLFALMAVELASRPPEPGGRPTTVLAYLLAAAVVAPFGWHRRHPVGAVLASGVAVVGYSLGHFSAYPGWASFALVFGVSLHAGRRRSLLALSVSLVALTASLALQPAGVADVATWVTTVLAVVVAVGTCRDASPARCVARARGTGRQPATRAGFGRTTRPTTFPKASACRPTGLSKKD